MNDLIEKLSNLRSQFNCFDENEREAYHTLSEVIKVLSERPELCEDAVSRRKAFEYFVSLWEALERSWIEKNGKMFAKLQQMSFHPSHRSGRRGSGLKMILPE